MRQITSVLCAVAIVFVSIGLAGSASAGFWEVTYDLEGSTSTTVTLLGSDVDPVTGTITFNFQGGGQGETPSSASYVKGTQHIDIYWAVQAGTPPQTVMTLSGSSDTSLTVAAASGVSVSISGNSILAFSIPDQTSTGNLHCGDLAGECAIAGFTNSVTQTLAPTGPPPHPFPYPKFIFNEKALVGDFTSTTQTQTATPNATVKFVYVGKEISRVYRNPIPNHLPVLSSRGIAGLGLSLALVGAISILGLRRRGGTKRG